MKKLFNIKTIGNIFLSIIVGYFVGELIKYVNLFGSSQNAPLVCAMAAGGASVLRLYNLKLKKTMKSDKKQK